MSVNSWSVRNKITLRRIEEERVVDHIIEPGKINFTVPATFGRVWNHAMVTYAILIGFCICLPSLANAEDKYLAAPPAEQYTVSPGGVDMRTGVYAYRKRDLSVADGSAGEMAFERMEDPGIPGHVAPFSSMSHNWDITITQRNRTFASFNPSSSTEYVVYVSINGRIETFQSFGTTTDYSQASRTPSSSITHTGTRGAGGEVYTFTAADGTVITFRPLGLVGASDCSDTVRCAYPSEMTSPDGTKYTFQYETRTGSSNRARLTAVSSSRGYTLLLEHGSGDWNLLTKACLYNRAVAIVPTGGLCDGSSLATASYSYVAYGGKSRLASVVDALSKTWAFTYFSDSSTPSNAFKMGFAKAGSATPWLVNVVGHVQNAFLVDTDIIYAQQFADGTSWTYSYNYSPVEIGTPPDQPATQIAGGEYVDGTGRHTTVQFDFPETPWSLSATLSSGGMPIVRILGVGYDDLVERLQTENVAQCNECGGGVGYTLHIGYNVTPGPVLITDPLNRHTSASYCDATAVFPLGEPYPCLVVGLIQSRTDPEGNQTRYKYSATRVTEVRTVAKPGSGLPDIVQSATYSNTANAKSWQKPLTVTDGNGNTTTYTYDTNHGGILTEVGPAVSGVSPAKKYAYAQRYAWLSNGSGYSQASTPVWVPTEERSCKTSVLDLSTGTCAAGPYDLIKTVYDYGPDSGPNNLWLRGVAVTAYDPVTNSLTTLRTCYGYDARGNRISQTSPRAGLTVCP